MTTEIQLAAGLRRDQRLVLPDWQVVSIYTEDFWEEVNCNGGGRRKIRRDWCNCGQEVRVEMDSKRTCRTDGKRIFYPDEPDRGSCVFRCKSCSEPIGDTCEAASYGQNDQRVAPAGSRTPTQDK